jgi:hypothetical protein
MYEMPKMVSPSPEVNEQMKSQETMPDGSTPTNLVAERKPGRGLETRSIYLTKAIMKPKSKVKWEQEQTLAELSIVGYLEGKMKFRIKQDSNQYSLESTSSLKTTYFKTAKGAKIAASRSLNKGKENGQTD